MVDIKPQTEAILHSIAGGAAIVLETLINHPLDTLKTRYQLIVSTPARQSPSLFQLTSNIIKQESIISLYRGMPPVLLMQLPRGMIKFGVNYSLQHFAYNTPRKLESQSNEPIIHCLSGFGTGLIDGFIVAPFEFVKVIHFFSGNKKEKRKSKNLFFLKEKWIYPYAIKE